MKPRPSDQGYLGLVGPILHAEVGDTIKVVFKNNATHPYSMHPHGVLYAKELGGRRLQRFYRRRRQVRRLRRSGRDPYLQLACPDRAGPGPRDPSSVFWLYHSHCDELRDVASGLFGGFVITRRGMARPDGTPKDVDKEFVTFFIAINENESWYLDDNIREHATDSKGINRGDFGPLTATGIAGTVAGTGFVPTNVKWSINGYIYGNMPMMVMKKGDHVRWYVTTLGDFNNAHYAPLARQYDHGRRSAHGRLLNDFCADDHGRHGARCSRNLASSLPHQRSHARWYGWPLRGHGTLTITRARVASIGQLSLAPNLPHRHGEP